MLHVTAGIISGQNSPSGAAFEYCGRGKPGAANPSLPLSLASQFPSRASEALSWLWLVFWELIFLTAAQWCKRHKETKHGSTL